MRMKKMRSPIFFMLTLFFILSLAVPDVSDADSVTLSNGKKVKGLILDEYKDRIVLATFAGEEVIMKDHIRFVVYDSEAKSLLRQGDNLVKRDYHIKAYYKYLEALEVDPEMFEAKDKLTVLSHYLENKMGKDVLKRINKRNEYYGKNGNALVLHKVERELGLTLRADGEHVAITEISSGNALNGSGRLLPGDKIVAVWREKTAHMDEREIAEKLLQYRELMMTIERTVEVELPVSKMLFRELVPAGYKSIIGARLDLEKEGLIINDVTAGGTFDQCKIKDGDRLFRIKGDNTRYMPRSKVVGMIQKNQGEKMNIVVRRDIVFWRKEQPA